MGNGKWGNGEWGMGNGKWARVAFGGICAVAMRRAACALEERCAALCCNRPLRSLAGEAGIR